MTRERRQKLVAGVVLTSVFLAGLFVGLFAGHMHTRRQMRAIFHGTPEEVETHLILFGLHRGLSLDDAQEQKVREIFDQHSAEHSKLREEIEPGLAKLRAEERAELRAVLNPKQQAKFDKMAERIDEQRKRVERVVDH